MSFRFDKLTIKSQEAVQRAQARAQEQGHPELGPLHLLAAMLEDSEGIFGPILNKMGANQSQLREMIDSELNRLPKVSGSSEPRVGSELNEVLQTRSRDDERRIRLDRTPAVGALQSRFEGQELVRAERHPRTRCS